MVVLHHLFVIPVIIGHSPWLLLVVPCQSLSSPPSLHLQSTPGPMSSASWVWVWLLVVQCVVTFGDIVRPWCLSMSLLYSPGDLQCCQRPISTHDPPCEQLLAGMGAGAGSSVMVGVCYGYSSCSGSPGMGRPCHHHHQLDTLVIHPTSSCSHAWGWCHKCVSQGLGPSMSAWSKMGLGWMPYYRCDSPGFNHFPKGLCLHSSVGTGILDRRSEEIYEHAPYKHTPQ